ncbi:acyltransferase [Hahella aquimaris]|uniref:acyltransferase n=1 Tax=Hahella sp. HNIBRBA332 TaxID=3015983 RepID=UPI00273A9E85|nr:acyltransferase [Hahella sp. HNIBRBA332]WLQ14611.1 acyltransferase [Hahella sp. HNIBRBA332]
MLSFLPHWLRGVLAVLLILLSTTILFPFVLALAFVKLLIPISVTRKYCTIALIGIAGLWININNGLLYLLHDIQWDVEGDSDLKPNDWYLVTCNHQTWADIPIVQRVLNGKVPMLKFFLKQELIWVPLIGVAWWALDFPFMKRYTREQIERNPALKGKDLETTKKACEKFKYTPVTVFNFLEGTRFTQAKHDHQKSPYKHLLKPKAGGAAFVLGAMGEHLHTMLNITIHYPGKALGFWGLASGQIKKVVIRIEKIRIPDQFLNRDYMNDAEFRSEFQEWIAQLWRRKDKQLEQLHQQYAS